MSILVPLDQPLLEAVEMPGGLLPGLLLAAGPTTGRRREVWGIQGLLREWPLARASGLSGQGFVWA